MTLADTLRNRIATDGPMAFEEYMAACLYDPEGGFFATGPLRSVKAGDFLTSPEVSPWFGRMLGRFVAGLGLDDPVVVDVGAGSGSLLVSLIEELDGRVEARAVEMSPAARRALATVLPDEQVHASLDDLPRKVSGVVIGNELLDNEPVALAVKNDSGWEERWVGTDGDGFALVAAPCRADVASWCDAFAGEVPEGGMVEVQLGAGELVTALLARIERGALVIADYGGTAEELEPRRTQGTLRTYRNHHLGPDPLLEPGATDITVDVNFTAMTAAAEAAGATVQLHRQDDWLRSLGLDDVIRDLRARELAEAADGDPMVRLELRSQRTDAETLLHPRGLGDFRVLVANK
jgi:SAM-dependent MidA family methyltransferase